MQSPATTRFDPPPLAVDGTTLWVLRRAFGPANAQTPAPSNPDQALVRAGVLGVAPRIADRTSQECLARELGAGGATAFAREARIALKATLAYDALAATLVQHALDLHHPVVFLKGYALHLAGHSSPGSRPVGDLDLLVGQQQAQPFHAALRQAGFETAVGGANEQHLPPLAAPGWGIVDVHYAIRGVCDESGTWIDAATALGGNGALEAISGGWVPGPSILAAHALAHAIEQHANNPRPYPLLRMVADLQDLLPGAAAWDAAMPSLATSLRPTLEEGEIESARDLVLSLTAGKVPDNPDESAGKLLAHFLAHAMNKEYRSSLRGDHLRHRLRQAHRRGTLLPYAGRKLLDLWRRIANR